MSEEASGRKVDSELANRLDSLFDEDHVESPSPAGKSADPLDELNSLVMSIEWEITDELMGRFVAQVETLKQRYQSDRILVMFLQLLGSLGLYVKSNKGNAHPAAFGLLNSVYASFAHAAMPGKISSSEKKKLLYVELNKYKELKEQIGHTRDTSKKDPSTQANIRESASPGPSDAMDRNDDELLIENHAGDNTLPLTVPQFEAAVESIKQLIQEEFKKLRDAMQQSDR